MTKIAYMTENDSNGELINFIQAIQLQGARDIIYRGKLKKLNLLKEELQEIANCQIEGYLNSSEDNKCYGNEEEFNY
jgi:hypothetical protein